MHPQMMVHTVFPDGTEQIKEDVMSDEDKAALAEKAKKIPMGEVSYAGGVTLNTGNYNSIRVDARITLPAPVNELDAVYDYCVTWVDAKITKAVAEAKEAYGLS